MLSCINVSTVITLNPQINVGFVNSLDLNSLFLSGDYSEEHFLVHQSSSEFVVMTDLPEHV